MATYPLQNAPHAGAQIAFTSPPASGDIAPCGSGMALLVVNPVANGTVTVSLPILPDQGFAVTPDLVTVPQGTSWVVPLVSSLYGPSVTLTYTGTLATVQVAAITFPGT